MAQYLLSVHGSDTDPIPDNVQEIYAAVEQFNNELRASGSWVFAGGLQPGIHRHRRRRHRRRRPGDHRRALPGIEGALGGFWIVDVPDLDAALELARRGPRPARVPSRCGRSSPSRAPERLVPDRARLDPATSTVFSVRSTVGSSPA